MLRIVAVALSVICCFAPPAGAQCTQDRLTVSTGAIGDRFGAAVAISGAVAVVGMPGSDSAGSDAGGAAIHRENGASTAWPLEQMLLPAALAAGDAFGASVSASGGIALVGAPGSDGTGGVDSGNVRVYRHLPQFGLWSASQTLVASDAQAGDEYGHAVAVRGGLALVGAWQEDSGGADTGAVYVHRQDVGTGFWLEEQKIVPFDGGIGDRFGAAVALENDLAVVGAIGPGIGAGALYIYRYDPGSGQWPLEQKIVPANSAPLDQFASSVAVSGDRIVAGAWRDDDVGPDSGTAYLYYRDPTSGLWSLEAELHAPDGVAGDRFGYSVALGGDLALVGASGDDAEGPASGSAYLFARDDLLGWTFVAKLADEPEGAAGDRFGESVALSGARALTGAPEHDGSAADSGAARVFVVAGEDCNGTGDPDLCDLLAGASADRNRNGIPDECDFVLPVTALACTRSGDDVLVTWENQADYDNILVSIDGLVPLQLPTGTISTVLVAPPLGFHAFDVTAVTNQVPSTTERCVIGLAPDPVAGLVCATGDPCLFEALLGWDPADLVVTGFEVDIDGVLAVSLPAGSTGTAVTAAGPDAHDLCVRTRLDDLHPDTGELAAILSDPVCCAVTIAAVPELPVEGLVCSIDPATCSASLAWTVASLYERIEILIDGAPALILDGTSSGTTIIVPAGGIVELCVVATTICGFVAPPVCCSVSCSADFVRGDANADGLFDIGDPVMVLLYLFGGAQIPCVAAADANDDDFVDISDVISILDGLFVGGPLPPPPFPGCGSAPSPLGCVGFAPCR